MEIYMSEFVAAIVMVGLALIFPILALAIFSIERLIDRHRVWREHRMPNRVRSLNG